MHIFLTGPLQVGKSTVIEKTLTLLGQPILGGFRTVSRETFLSQALAEVYLIPAGRPPIYDRLHLTGIRWGDGLFTAFPEVFDLTGVELLLDIQHSLMLMNEQLLLNLLQLILSILVLSYLFFLLYHHLLLKQLLNQYLIHLLHLQHC